MASGGGGIGRLLAGLLTGALALFGLAACGDLGVPGACGQGGPVPSNLPRPSLIFACSASPVDGGPAYQLWRLLPHGARRLSAAPAEDPSVAPAAARLAFESTARGRPEIFVSGLGLAAPHAVGAEPGGQSEPAWSHDGSRLAYVSGQRGLRAPVGVSGAFGSVFVSSAAGSGAHAVTPDDAYAGEPAWAPKGSRIAYATDRGGFWSLATTSPDGRDTRPLTTTGDAQWPSWSPDGTQIAYQWSATVTGDPSVWVMDANGSHPHRLASGGEPSWSPDGKWIAFERKTDAGSDLWMASSRGGTPVRLTDDAGLKGRPAWV